MQIQKHQLFLIYMYLLIIIITIIIIIIIINVTVINYHKQYLATVGPRGSAVERQSLASVLSPSCARPVADG